MSLYMEQVRGVIKYSEHLPPKTDCVICDQKALWFSNSQKIAHRTCLIKISRAESNLIKFINEKYPNSLDQQKGVKAYNRAIKAVKKACAPDKITVFLEKNGEAKLKTLFDTIGIEEAKRDRAKL